MRLSIRCELQFRPLTCSVTSVPKLTSGHAGCQSSLRPAGRKRSWRSDPEAVTLKPMSRSALGSSGAGEITRVLP